MQPATQPLLTQLIAQFPRPAVSTRAVAQSLSMLRLPEIEAVPQRQLTLAVATLHTEVMWGCVADWVRQHRPGLAKDSKANAFLSDVTPLEDESQWPARDLDADSKCAALQHTTSIVLDAGLREACGEIRREWMLNETSRSLLEFSGVPDVYAFVHRGMTTAQNEFWEMVPILPELFREKFGHPPGISDYRRLLGALSNHNYRYSHGPVEMLAAIGTAVAHLSGYMTAEGKMGRHLSKVHRLLSRGTLDLTPEVVNHAAVQAVVAAKPIRYACPAAAARTSKRVGSASNNQAPGGRVTVVQAHAEWCSSLAERIVLPELILEGRVTDRR